MSKNAERDKERADLNTDLDREGIESVEVQFAQIMITTKAGSVYYVYTDKELNWQRVNTGEKQ